MRLRTAVTAAISTCMLIATDASALVTTYGQRQIEEASAGCVGGSISGHGNTAYFRGDTARLNQQLTSLAKTIPDDRSVVVVLFAGAKFVDSAEEKPQTGFGAPSRDQVMIDWSVSKSCKFDEVVTGVCKCNNMDVTVNIWISNNIRLNELIVPTEFVVRSAGEIAAFVKQHATRN